jgi:hypothetical protein
LFYGGWIAKASHSLALPACRCWELANSKSLIAEFHHDYFLLRIADFGLRIGITALREVHGAMGTFPDWKQMRCEVGTVPSYWLLAAWCGQKPS